MNRLNSDNEASIDLIIYRFFSGTSNKMENEILMDWINESVRNLKTYVYLKRIWLEYNETFCDDDDNDKLWDDIIIKLRENRGGQ